MTNTLTIKNQEGLEFLKSLESNSVDLVLTDPPYIISHETGMDKWMDKVIKIDAAGTDERTEVQWEKFLADNEDKKLHEDSKRNYLRYGSIYGKKYAVKTDYGEWDSGFTLEEMNQFIKEYYRVLRPGGTCIVFFDIWKITPLKEQLEASKFKQLRFIEWIKTNPQPLNSGVNYLTNCREIALLGIKKSKPTFNSKYNKAVYEYPIQGGKERWHPTQKSLPLFEELIEIHSNEGDVVLDTFLGAGTTAVAAKRTGRNFVGCELDKETYLKAKRWASTARIPLKTDEEQKK
jgi:DNA modification methylase